MGRHKSLKYRICVILVSAFATVMTLADSHLETPSASPRDLAEKVHDLNARFRTTQDKSYLDQADEILDGLSDEQRDAFDEAYQQVQKEHLEENARFERELAALQGDVASAELAALFSSMLFEVDKPFEEALKENLLTWMEYTAPTDEQLVARQALFEQNQRVAQANAEQAGLAMRGQIQQEAGTLIGEGFEGDGMLDEVFHREAGLLTQDGHIMQLLQLRAQLDLINRGTGEITEGNYRTQSGAETFNEVSDIFREIGERRLVDEDDPQIAVLEAEAQSILAMNGVVETPELMAVRENLINALTPMSEDVGDKWDEWKTLEAKYREYERAKTLLPVMRSQPPPGSMEEAWKNWEAEIAYLEEVLETPYTEGQVKAAERAYLAALDQSPLLRAQVVTGSFDGMLWEFLRFDRPMDQKQQALDDAIDFLDGTTFRLLVDYGSIVSVEDLYQTYGSPAFDGLRNQIATELDGIYPGVRENMDALESLWDANYQAGEVSRLIFDGGIAFAQVVVGGIIVLFPVTIPILVPVEIGLAGLQIGVEYDRYVAVRTERDEVSTLAQAGCTSNLTLVRYNDLLTQQTTVLMVNGLLLPLQGVASAGDVVVYMGMRNARLASQTGRAAGEVAATGGRSGDGAIGGGGTAGGAMDDTQIFRPGTFDPAPPTGARVPSADEFADMTAEGRAAALSGLSEADRVRLVSQLSQADQEALGTALVYQGIVRGIREDPGAVWYRPGGGGFSQLTPQQVAQLTDEEIVQAVKTGGIILSPDSKKALGALTDDDPIAGPFSLLQGVDEADEFGDLPVRGYFVSSDLTPAQVDELFSIDVDSLPVGQRQTVLLQRADALRQGLRPTIPIDEATEHAILRNAIIAIQKAEKRVLGPEELTYLGWRAEWGAAPPYPPPAATAAGAADGSGTVFNTGRQAGGGSDTGEFTEVGVPRGMENAPGERVTPGWNESGMSFGEGSGTVIDAGRGAGVATDAAADGAFGPQPFLSLDDILNNRIFYRDLPEPPGQGFMPSMFEDWDFRRTVYGVESGPLVRHLTAIDDQQQSVQPFLNALRARRAAGETPPASSGQVMQQGSAIIHLNPFKFDAWTIPGDKLPLWQNYLFRCFHAGACQGDSTRACDNETPIGVLSVPFDMQDEVAVSLGADPRVARVERNSGRFRQVTVNDPLFSSRGSWEQPFADQWGLHQVGLTGEQGDWSASASDAEPVIVAVIDTGLAWSHPDFQHSGLWINEGEIPWNNIDDDHNGYVDDIAGWNFLDQKPVAWDFDGHGTLVASIIAARSGNGIGIAGVNPNVRIMPLKAVNNAGRSRAAWVAEAIIYAANNGARIINLSVGGPELTHLEQLAIDFAHSQGVLVVAAAGNEGRELSDYGPAGADHVLTVAATGPGDERLKASNWGAQVDLAAPGQDIVGLRAPATDLMTTADRDGYVPRSQFVGEDQLYYRATGTSFAAPLVAGTASLLLAAKPGLSGDQLERMLVNSAQDIGPPGIDQLTGYGRLDAVAALAAEPDFFLVAQVAGVGVAEQGGAPVIAVRGTADADRFGRAWLELGPGKDPSEWHRVGSGIDQPVRAGVIDAFDPRELAGTAQWTLRLVIEHQDGSRRETRYLINTS